MTRNPLRLFGRGPVPSPAPEGRAEPDWPPALLDGWPDAGGGPATRAARPVPLRSPTDDPPTDPHGWPAVGRADPPLDPSPAEMTPLVSLPFGPPTPESRLTEVAAAHSLLLDQRPPPAGTAAPAVPDRSDPGGVRRGRPAPGARAPRPSPWPPPELAEAVGLAAAFGADYLSWDEADAGRRGLVLAGYLRDPGADPARLGWDGTGRQRAELAVPGRVVVDGKGRLLVDVRVRVTPYRLVGTPAAEPDPEPGGTPAVAPAPTARGWRSCASLWVRLTVPVLRDGPRLAVDRWDDDGTTGTGPDAPGG
jgi:hypothetical protein